MAIRLKNQFIQKMKSDFNLYLYKERAKNSSDHALVRLISHIGHASITIFLIWKLVPHDSLIIWYLGSLLLSTVFFFLQKSLSPSKSFYSKKKWAITNITGAFATSFYWGLAPALFFISDNTLFIVFIVALYAGYISGALAVNSSYKYSFIAFAVGISIPFITRLLYEGGSLNNTIAGLCVFYILMLTHVSHNMHKQFIKSVENQYNNEILIKELAGKKTIIEKAITSKDKFFASASHDLRQPLNAISLFTDALKPLQSTEKGNEILAKIRQSLNGINGMLHALLDISRLDADNIENKPQHVAVKQILDQLHEEYRHNRKKLTIQAVSSIHTTAYVDPILLYRILNNLLDNAVKYTNSGQITITSKDMSNDSIQVTVEDTGIGIAEDKISTIFEEFQQLNNPERDREKGLGLGLSIVKRICEIADIELDMQSQIGIGTQVYLTLQRGAALAETQIEKNQPHNNLLLKDKFILVIDDEKHILDGMNYLLSSYGCEVITAESAQLALEKLLQQPKIPDLIISDLRLRNELTGIQAIDAIRDEYNIEIPALLVTGDTSSDLISKSHADQYDTLYKPIDPDDLKLKIQSLVC